MTEKNIIKSFLILTYSRKEIIFAVSWGASLATVIAGKGFPPIFISIQSMIAVIMLSLSVYIYNDIVDREMDAYSEKEKKKGRPIAHKRVTLPTAYKFVVFTAIIGLGLSYILGLTTFLIGLIYYITFFFYSYPKIRFKTMFIIKNVVTSAIIPVAILIGGTAVEGRISPIIFFSSGALYIFTFLVLPAGADCLDLEEDKAFGIKTIGGTLTWKQNIILFDSGIIILTLLTAIAYKQLFFTYHTPLLIGSFGLALMIFTIKLLNEDGKIASYKLRPVGYAYLMLIPLFLLLGIIL